MQIDLQTLWYLTIGTLLVSAAGLFWERQAHRSRAGLLGTLAASLVAFALGCVVAMTRAHFPGAGGLLLTNALMMCGYLLVLDCAARFDGRHRLGWTTAILSVLALLWATVGTRFPLIFWNHVSALPIGLTCGLTAWTLLRSRTVLRLRSRPVAAAVSAIHALFYLGRATVTPVLALRYGDAVLSVVAKATMYEAVLYSVAMPMSFLALVREEEQELLRRESRTDHLTGLTNRLGFFEQGRRILAAHTGNPVSLLAFDLDHFKSINDRYGHAVGDEVLRLFADTARDAAGPNALLVRLGGEEFAALLPGLGHQQAREVGLTIARRFKAAAGRADGLGIEATVSIGLAEPVPGRNDLGEVLACADRALYRAKVLGRDRLEVSGPAAVMAAA
jgi:diguanylate cyclase (GGDEF)-like protein